jgi:hypothetical protein
MHMPAPAETLSDDRSTESDALPEGGTQSSADLADAGSVRDGTRPPGSGAPPGEAASAPAGASGPPASSDVVTAADGTAVGGTAPDGAAPGADSARAARPPLPPLPGSRRQRFRVFWGDFSDGRSVARLEYRLVNEGDRYELRTDAEAEGLISLVYSGTLTQLSTGRLGPAGLEPLRYAELRPRRPERAVTFQPAARRLLPLGGGAPVPMPAGTQDRLSVFYQLGLMARADPAAFGAGTAVEVPVATMREVRIERFQVVGDDVLVVPGGPIRALHLFRPTPEGTSDPRIDLWLGYDFEMLPVRLRIEDPSKGVLDQVIDRDG